MDRAALDAAILSAHAKDDGAALAGLYAKAGRAHLAAGEIDAGCFFLTQAYIFALEAGHDDAPALRALLKQHGRED